MSLVVFSVHALVKLLLLLLLLLLVVVVVVVLWTSCCCCFSSLPNERFVARAAGNIRARAAGWEGGGCTHVMHGRGRTNIDPRIPTNAGTERVGFCADQARHRLHRARSAVRVLGEPHEGWGALY